MGDTSEMPTMCRVHGISTSRKARLPSACATGRRPTPSVPVVAVPVVAIPVVAAGGGGSRTIRNVTSSPAQTMAPVTRPARP